MTIVDLWLNFLLGIGLPALVALVSNRFATHRFKALMLAALTGVTVVVQTLIENGVDFSDWQTLITRFFMTFITAVTAHYGLLKPTGVTGVDGAIPKSVPSGAGGRHARGRAPDAA